MTDSHAEPADETRTNAVGTDRTVLERLDRAREFARDVRVGDPMEFEEHVQKLVEVEATLENVARELRELERSSMLLFSWEDLARGGER